MTNNKDNPAGELYQYKFPEELYGVVIEGIDVTILCSDSVRLIEAYVKQEGELSEIQRRVLQQCERELSLVIPKTDGHIKKYFQRLHQGIADAINKCKMGDKF